VDRADLKKAGEYASEALRLFRAISDEPGIAKALWALGNVHRLEGEYRAAVPALQEAIDRFRRLDDRFNLAWSLHTLGLVSFHLDDLGKAREYWRESLETFAAARDVSGIAMGFDNFASLATREGDPVRGLRLAGASGVMTSASGAGLRSVVNALEGRSAESRSLDQTEAEAAAAEGQELTTEEAIAYALQGTWPQRLQKAGPGV